MKFINKAAALAALTALNAGQVSSEAAKFCPDNGNICFQWGVPQATAKAGSGDVYFQMKAPTENQWVGLGIGSRMLNSPMFVMYQDGNGNVTLSTRTGRNHIMPLHVDRKDVELLAGSGVVGGDMVANIKCSGCSDLDLTGEGDWITAYKVGSPLDSTSPSATITMHDQHINFQVDLSKASISSDANPFTGSGGSTKGGSTGGGSSGGSSGGDGDGDSDDAGGAVTESKSNTTKLIFAHGIIMTVVFVAMYPLGAVLMPLLGKWYLHAGWQSIAFLLMWAGFGVGYTVASKKRLDIFFDQTHTQLGVFVVALMVIQPLLGWFHHFQFRRTQKRGIFSYIHCWYGRAIMILGIINGGLGLKLAKADKKFVIGYSVAAGIVAVIYIASAGFGLVKGRRSTTKRLDSPSVTNDNSGPETQEARV